jgi:hypothetical protein
MTIYTVHAIGRCESCREPVYDNDMTAIALLSDVERMWHARCYEYARFEKP